MTEKHLTKPAPRPAGCNSTPYEPDRADVVGTAPTMQSVLDRLTTLEAQGLPLRGDWGITKSLDDLTRYHAELMRIACDIDLADRFLTAAIYDLSVKRGRRQPGHQEAMVVLHGISADMQTLTDEIKRLVGMHDTYLRHGQVVMGVPEAPSKGGH